MRATVSSNAAITHAGPTNEPAVRPSFVGVVQKTEQQTSEDLDSFLKVAVMPRTSLARSVAIFICTII